MPSTNNKAYYKSRRKTVEFDSVTQHYYFTVANDETNTKYCYVDFKMVSYGNVTYVVGLNTYKLHKNGARMVRYDWLLTFEKELSNINSEYGRELNSITSDIAAAQAQARWDFEAKWKDRVQAFNTALVGKLINNELTKL